MVNHTLSQLRASSPFRATVLTLQSNKASLLRLACIAFLALSLGLSSFGAHLLETSATSFSYHLLTSHHLYSPAPIAGGGCGATTSDC
jgi:hypothetical protein